MFNRSLRRAALIVALPAFMAAATTAPALATSKYDDDDKKKKVTVEICKEVKYGGYKHDKKDYDKPKFEIKVWTDEKEKRVKLRDGDCKEFNLKYDDYKKVNVKEYVPDGYKFKKLECYDGHGDYYHSNYDKSCDIKKYYKKDDDKKDYDKKDYVKIVVVNKKYDKKH